MRLPNARRLKNPKPTSPQRAVMLGAAAGGSLGVFCLLVVVFFGTLIKGGSNLPPNMSGAPVSGFDRLAAAFNDAMYAAVMLGLHLGLTAGVVGVGVGVAAGYFWARLRGRGS